MGDILVTMNGSAKAIQRHLLALGQTEYMISLTYVVLTIVNFFES